MVFPRSHNLTLWKGMHIIIAVYNLAGNVPTGSKKRVQHQGHTMYMYVKYMYVHVHVAHGRWGNSLARGPSEVDHPVKCTLPLGTAWSEFCQISFPRLPSESCFGANLHLIPCPLYSADIRKRTCHSVKIWWLIHQQTYHMLKTLHDAIHEHICDNWMSIALGVQDTKQCHPRAMMLQQKSK